MSCTVTLHNRLCCELRIMTKYWVLVYFLKENHFTTSFWLLFSQKKFMILGIKKWVTLVHSIVKLSINFPWKFQSIWLKTLGSGISQVFQPNALKLCSYLLSFLQFRKLSENLMSRKQALKLSWRLWFFTQKNRCQLFKIFKILHRHIFVLFSSHHQFLLLNSD